VSVTRLARALAYVVLVAVGLVGLTLATFSVQAGRREVHARVDGAPPTGRFVSAGDVEVFVQEAGPPAGPAVLFVHGTGAWSETWRESMTALAATGYRAIAIDLPPFGYSQRPDRPRYGKREQGQRIVAVVDALQIPRVILVGHSFGGGPTVEATVLAPERVGGLVLVDAALGVRTDGAPATPSPALMRGFLAVAPLRDALVATFLTNPLFTRRLLQAFIADPAHATDERVRVYQRPLTVQGSTRAIGEWLPALLAPGAPAASEDPAVYRALAMPLVVIWGDRDTITPLEQGQRLAGLAPGAQLLVLDGVGHIPHIEAPPRFNDLLLKVIDGLRRRIARSAGAPTRRRQVPAG
jgi:pimeloyl-ACP methyl ester carboxylesterase